MDRGMYRKGPHGPFCVFIGGGACASSRQDKGCFVTDTQTRITSLVTPLLESLGLELWGLEYLPSSGRSLLRVYINVADRPVGIEDFDSASRGISAALDVHDPNRSEESSLGKACVSKCNSRWSA